VLSEMGVNEILSQETGAGTAHAQRAQRRWWPCSLCLLELRRALTCAEGCAAVEWCWAVHISRHFMYTCSQFVLLPQIGQVND